MSDAMTNREIEDVLTSIRRLVAQEGGRNSETGRLILTEAQRIVTAAAPASNPEPFTAPQDESSEGNEGFVAPLELTDPVMNADAEDPRGDEHGLPAPDFGQLEATIAELEAAVSGGSGDVSADETADELDDASRAASMLEGQVQQNDDEEPSNVTALYGRLSFQHRRQALAPQETAPPSEADMAPGVGESATASEETPAMQVAPPEPEAVMDRYALPDDGPRDRGGQEPAKDDPSTVQEPAEDDATALQEPGTVEAADEAPEDTVIDEAMLRAVVAQIVREELHGQLGERITLQVRKLVRAEIAKALDERNFL